MKRVPSCSVLVLVAAMATMPADFAQQPAREFSADTVTHDSAGKVTRGKLYRGTSMIRTESVDSQAGPDSAAFGIVDLAQQISYTVIPGRKMIMVRHGKAALGNLGIMLPVGDNPCTSQGVAPSDVTCKNLGPDPVNGRPTVKWQVTQPMGGQMVTAFLWVDSQLHALIKEVVGPTSVELRNIHEGPQPANLFELPAAYQRTEVGRR
jgi:hypothetical protein